MLAYIENPVEDKWIGDPKEGKINRAPAEKLMKEFDTKEKADAALAELKAYWDKLLSHFTVSSSEEKLDRMVNIWHQYQCMVTFNMSRSASYFESGIGRGMGFRDSCQDLLGFVHLIPDCARERILDIAATQFEDGSAYHQYQPLTKKGNSDIGSGFNNDPLWLIAGTAAYIKETGDYSILDEMTPYDSDPSKATDFMEHLRRSFHYTVDHLGPHKLPLIGRADWNDCLNLNCFSTEPYVYSQMIAGKDAKNFGEAQNSWLTGTAAWTFLNVSQFILGIRPDYDGLVVDPCIPSDMDGFTAKRDFRGVTYNTTVKNPNHVEKGVVSMIVDGVSVNGNTIPLPDGRTSVDVELIMG